MAATSQRVSVHVNAMGPLGDYISDTDPHTADGPAWRYIFAHSDTVIASATSTGGCPSGTLTNVELPAGTVWAGRFTAVQLTSGSITCYRE